MYHIDVPVCAHIYTGCHIAHGVYSGRSSAAASGSSPSAGSAVPLQEPLGLPLAFALRLPLALALNKFLGLPFALGLGGITLAEALGSSCKFAIPDLYVLPSAQVHTATPSGPGSNSCLSIFTACSLGLL